LSLVMNQALGPPATALVADIGGTNARFAIAELGASGLSHVMQFPCTSHRGLDAAIRHYLDQVGVRPTHACIAVAGPVTDEEIAFTNSDWSFTTSGLRRELGLEGLLVINDFHAFALALPDLAPHELHQIGGVTHQEHGTKVAIGVGTGTGVAALVWTPSGWHAIPSEGGHSSLACDTAEDFALAERVRAGLPHLSVERILSGPGIGNLYRAIASSRGRNVETLIPDEVVTRALAETDDIAVETLQRFVRWFGSFAADTALMFGAKGGVYLGGGITPRILDLLRPSLFREAFEAKGRMKDYLAPIPVYAVLAEYLALRGAAIHASQAFSPAP
jgi:glucokinase